MLVYSILTKAHKMFQSDKILFIDNLVYFVVLCCMHECIILYIASYMPRYVCCVYMMYRTCECCDFVYIHVHVEWKNINEFLVFSLTDVYLCQRIAFSIVFFWVEKINFKEMSWLEFFILLLVGCLLSFSKGDFFTFTMKWV